MVIILQESTTFLKFLTNVMVFSRMVKLHQEQPTKLVLFSGSSLIKPQLPAEETIPDSVFMTAPNRGHCLQAAPTVLHLPHHLGYRRLNSLKELPQRMNSTAPGRTFPELLNLLRVIQRVFGKFGCRTSFLISKDRKMEQAFPRQTFIKS